MSQPPDIYIKNASLCFDQKIIFDQLSLDFPANKWTCLLGSSGVGKSTLLRIIAELNNASQSSGAVITSDQKPLAGRIAYMAQRDLLMPWLNALDNVLIGCCLRRGRASVAEKQQAQHLLEQVGLGDSIKLYPASLSGGMRQRVALARTLMEDKPIVLMDEAFSALDAATKQILYALFTKLLANKSVIMVTHDPLEAVRLGHHIHVFAGSPAKIIKTLDLKPEVRPRDMRRADIIAWQSEILQEMVASGTLS